LFVPLNTLAYSGLPPGKSNDASALINLMRNLGGSVGISYTTTLLAYGEQIHHARLAEHITPYDGYGFGRALGTIAQAVVRQATMLTYIDVFWALAIASAIAAPLALCLPRLPKGEAAAAH
jgi:DHA2 family multidrug resistance protein